MFDSPQLLVGGWPYPSFLLFSIVWCALEPMSHVREGHLLAARTLHIDPLGQSLQQWGTSLYVAPKWNTQRKSTTWKRERAAGQENSLRATNVSSCQCTSTWAHPDPSTVHRAADPSPSTLHLCCVHVGQAKQEQTLLLQLSSCLTCTSRPLYCLLSTALTPSFLQLKLWWYAKCLQRRKLWKAINLHWPFKLTAMLEQPGCSTLPLHSPPPIWCSIRSSWREGKWNSFHESTKKRWFFFYLQEHFKRKKIKDTQVYLLNY